MSQSGLISLKTGEFAFNGAEPQREIKIQRRNSISMHFIFSDSIALFLKMIHCIYIHLFYAYKHSVFGCHKSKFK